MTRFKDKYCEATGCEPSKFEKTLFRRAVPFHARLLAPFILAFQHDFFAPEWRLVESMGRRTNLSDARYDMDFYHFKFVEGSFLREILSFRARLGRLRGVASKLLPVEPAVPEELRKSKKVLKPASHVPQKNRAKGQKAPWQAAAVR